MADPIQQPTVTSTAAPPLPPAGDDFDAYATKFITSPEYKSANPALQKVMKDVLIEKYVTARTPGGTTFKNVPQALQNNTAIQSTESSLQDKHNAISGLSETPEEKMARTFVNPNFRSDKATESLPAMGGMLATAAAGPEASFLRRLAYAFLGGAGGEGVAQAANQVTNKKPADAGDIAGEMAMSGFGQGALETLGSLLAFPLQKLMGGLKGNAPATAAEIANKKYGIGMTPGQQSRDIVAQTVERLAEHNTAGYAAAEPFREKIDSASAKVAQDIVKDAFGDGESSLLGKRVQEAIARGGKPSWQKMVEVFSSMVNAKTLDKTVDVRALKAQAARELADAETLQVRPADQSRAAQGSPLLYGPNNQVIATTSNQPVKLDTAGLSTGAKAILEDIVKMKDQISFADARNLRSKWMGIGPQSTELMSNEAKGTAKHYVQEMTGALDSAVGNDPQAKQVWNMFRNFTRKGAEVFESPAIDQMVNTQPEKVAQLIGAKDHTIALQAKRAIFGYADTYGDPKQRAAASRAWDAFRGVYIRENLLSGDLKTLSDRLQSLSPGVRRTVFGDVQGKSVMSNLQLIGDAMQRLDQVTERGTGSRWQILRAIPSAWVVKMAYSPEASKYFVRGLNGIMRDSQSAPVRAIGRASSAATPYLGTAAADILRALQIANSIDEATTPKPAEVQ